MGAFVEYVVVKSVSPDFKMKSRIIGERGRNCQHIHFTTGATVRVEGENDESMQCRISADTQEAVDKAHRLVVDLLEKAYHDYDDWLKNNEVGEEPPRKHPRRS